MKKMIGALFLFSAGANAGLISDEQLHTYWLTPEQSATQIVKGMGFEEKIGQILMMDFRYWGDDPQDNKQPLINSDTALQKLIQDKHLGSVILFRENLIDTPQTVRLINDLQQARSNLPLFISTDQEGGYVTRLRVGTEMPGNMALGATGSPRLAQMAGGIHGKELSSLGFNFNFGPVVDVNNNQNNPVIGVRAYSDDPNLVSELAKSYITGIHQYPVLTSLKHFPGHGNVASDTHFALPTIPIDRAAWQQVELKPFKETLPWTDAIMTAHVVVPALDNSKLRTRNGEQVGTPATLSYPILTGLLRDQLKFNGLILTDAMDMGAISANFEPEWAVKQAILAGNDIILMPMEIKSETDAQRLDALYHYLKTEAERDPVLQARIDESAIRVVYTKLAKKISASPRDADIAAKIVGSQQHKDSENFIAEQAVTLIKNDGVLPFPLKHTNSVLVYSDEAPRNALIAKHLNDIAREYHCQIAVNSQVVKLAQNTLTREEIERQMADQQLVILATYNLTRDPQNAQNIIDAAQKARIPLVVIATRNPYDIAYLNNVQANIAIYGITGFDVTNNVRNSLETNIRSGLRTLFKGPNNQPPLTIPHGKLPVDIKSPDGSTVVYSRSHGLNGY
ncbi:glycoside hydrolase family 3 protein [Atlantibacter sp.]|uniref:glycoside hydrolase family 3 protein n=1 Tax=Atlantibacter sp. TaxID=1903473 RepID=UPI0028A82CFA|nr:glycoside hydrolase family 3 protein [Atlantibacter sp.]